MESFYGGRPGASFIIVKTFQTIAKMKQAFQKGTGYNQVYFDEYVTIYNTSEPAYKYNGNVYRRGYDINNGKPPGHPAPILNANGQIIGWS